MNKKLEFNGPLVSAGGGGVFVEVPFNVQEVFGMKGLIPITASIDGEPYSGSLANMGTGCHILIVLKAIREKIGKQVGDSVHVILERDTKERAVDVPQALVQLLDGNAQAKTFFDGLSYSNKKEYARWINEAKREETRQNRLTLTLEKLLAGKKNPTEK